MNPDKCKNNTIEEDQIVSCNEFNTIITCLLQNIRTSFSVEQSLPPNQGIQGKSGNFILFSIRENQGSFRVS